MLWACEDLAGGEPSTGYCRGTSARVLGAVAKRSLRLLLSGMMLGEQVPFHMSLLFFRAFRP